MILWMECCFKNKEIPSKKKRSLKLQKKGFFKKKALPAPTPDYSSDFKRATAFFASLCPCSKAFLYQ